MQSPSKLSLALAAVAAAGALASSAHAAVSCESLPSLSIPSTTIVKATAATPPYTATGPGGTGVVKVPFCRVEGTTRPSANSEVKFDVWLPANWNGRLKTEATGGYAGGAPYGRMADQINYGFAEAGSNMGHDGGQSPSWDFGNPESLTTYGYAAHNWVAKAAKAVVEAYYGKKANYSYFDGCSNGGRQAHLVAQRYPDLYDGFLIGAPSNYYSQVLLYLMWHQKMLKPNSPNDAALLSPAKLNLLATTVMNACDARDGLTDNLIADPRACKFDPGVLACTAGATDTTGCLTTTELNVAREIYKGPHTSRGESLYMGAMPGAENNWNVAFGDNGGYGNFSRDVVIQDPNWNWRTIDWDKQGPLIRDVVAPIMSAPNPDYTAQRARGVKILQYHGWFDPVVTPQGSGNYYNAMLAWESMKGSANPGALIDALTPEQVQANIIAATNYPLDNFRLFMVPGMGHCSGGTSPNSFGQSATTPGSVNDADHDAVLALVRWVEQGIAPNFIIATEFVNNDPTRGIKRERPLCPYPKIAQYVGIGSVDRADSFVCAAPPADNLLPGPDDMMEVKWALNNRQAMPTTVWPGVIEYYNASLRQYFLTAQANEIAALNAGALPGWTKTGGWINSALATTSGVNPVCRYYLPPSSGGAHFYSALPAECAAISTAYPQFVQETSAAFYQAVPASVTGSCPSGMVPVYRVWNGLAAANHRYTTRRDIRDAMVAQGWIAEGTGPNAVTMCAPQ